MVTQTLGPVAIVYRGAYGASVSYRNGHVATYGGDTYLCISRTEIQGVPPMVNGTVNTAYWALSSDNSASRAAAAAATTAAAAADAARQTLAAIPVNAAGGYALLDGSAKLAEAFLPDRLTGASPWAGGRNLKDVFGTAAALHTAVSAGDFSRIRIGDYWPVTLSGTYRDFSAYTCPGGTAYYSDAGLGIYVGTTAQSCEAAYVNATCCSVTVGGATCYVSTALCSAYFDRTFSDTVFKMEVAGINPFFNYGDTALAVAHLLFCSADLIAQTVRMRAGNGLWQDAAAANPWLGSALFATLNNASYGLLPLLAASDIGAYLYGGPNGKGMRCLAELKGSGVAAATGMSWIDRGKLFLPT